jgi:hypothetical protein
LIPTVEIRQPRISSKTRSGIPIIVMSRNTELVLKDKKGAEKATHRIPYGARLAWLTEDGDKVKPGQKLAEWDPYTLPILTEKDGTANFFDLVEGVSVTEKMDEATGISSTRKSSTGVHSPRAVTSSRVLPCMTSKGKIITLPNGLPANYYLSVDAFCPLKTVRKSRRAISSRVSRVKLRKHATLRAVCRALPNSSKRAVRKTSRSSPTSMVTLNSARTTNPSAASL